jgi:[acyl-carrier-protein] S-malonyltransferase
MLGKVLAVFPGQGSQFVGMSKDLWDNFKVVRETFEEAEAATSMYLKKLCFDGPENDLSLTSNLQPCLLAVSVSAYRVAAQEGLFIDAVAGHSLGEFSALVCNRAITLTQAAQWVKIRGLAMQRAVPVGQGSMAAVIGATQETLEMYCKRAIESAILKRKENPASHWQIPATVSPANYNTPTQIVVSGSCDAVDLLGNLLKETSCRYIPLNVSAPFHCSLMRPARETLQETLKNQSVNSMQVPYFPNRTAQLTQESSAIIPLLIEQVDQAVLWTQSIQNAFSLGFETVVEIAPGKVLSGLIKKIEPKMQLIAISNVNSVKDLGKML